MTEDEKTIWRANEMHDRGLERLLGTWDLKVHLLQTMKDLKTVRLDFNTCYCQSGCCRRVLFQAVPVERCLESLRLGDSSSVHGRPGITFVGLQSQAERTLLSEMYGFRKLATSSIAPRHWSLRVRGLIMKIANTNRKKQMRTRNMRPRSWTFMMIRKSAWRAH